MTGEIAEPTTEPRPVENRMTWLPQAISSAISALSLMLGKPKRDLAVGHDVEQVEPARRRTVARLDQAGDAATRPDLA